MYMFEEIKNKYAYCLVSFHLFCGFNGMPYAIKS